MTVCVDIERPSADGRLGGMCRRHVELVGVGFVTDIVGPVDIKRPRFRPEVCADGDRRVVRAGLYKRSIRTERI
jgi:hypothetical protein